MKSGIIAPVLFAAFYVLPVGATQKDMLSSVREYAMHYTEQLPNYVGTQVTRREMGRTWGNAGVLMGRTTDVIREQLAYTGNGERYTVVTVNGQKVRNVQHNELRGGPVSSGEFGSLLHQIFDPASETSFKQLRDGKLNGRSVALYEFQVPQQHGYRIYDEASKRELLAAFEGKFYMDSQTNAVLRIEMHCVKIPSSFAVKQVQMTLDYRPVLLAGEVYVLPSRFHLETSESGYQAKIDAQYEEYRKFSVESQILFDNSDAADPQQ